MTHSHTPGPMIVRYRGQLDERLPDGGRHGTLDWTPVYRTRPSISKLKRHFRKLLKQLGNRAIIEVEVLDWDDEYNEARELLDIIPQHELEKDQVKP